MDQLLELGNVEPIAEPLLGRSSLCSIFPVAIIHGDPPVPAEMGDAIIPQPTTPPKRESLPWLHVRFLPPDDHEPSPATEANIGKVKGQQSISVSQIQKIVSLGIQAVL